MLHSLCKQCHGDKCRSRASGSYEVSVTDKVAQYIYNLHVSAITLKHLHVGSIRKL